MARPPKFDWERIRAEYEAGASQSELSRKHGASRAAIQKHIEAEGWAQDVEPVLQRKVAEKVAGIVAGCNPEKRADALDAAAQRRADVELRHQVEWDEHKALIDKALANKDFEAAKLAKITAETLKIRQEAERKAWRIDLAQPPAAMSVTVSNLTNIASPDEVRRILAADRVGALPL